VSSRLSWRSLSATTRKAPTLASIRLSVPLISYTVIAVSNWPTLTATWQVEVLREHVARVRIGRMIAFAAPTAVAAVSVAEVVAIAVM
jgi:hypothetical protein